MVGLSVGLVATLAITQIVLNAEGHKRTTVSGTDAQVAGILAMDTLRSAIQSAGYGYSSLKATIGCPLEARFNGNPIPGFAAQLVPVAITDGDADAPDEIRVLSSSKAGLALPLAVTDPGYVPADPTLGSSFPVTYAAGVAPLDLLLAYHEGSPCQVFQASAVDAGRVHRSTDSGWNPAGFPSQSFSANAFLVNLGALEDVAYSVGDAGTLQFNQLQIGARSSPSYSGHVSLYSNIVNLQAYYGKASSVDGVSVLTGPIDTWDTTSPSSNAQWLQVRAIKIALVSRSEQYEKNAVTTRDPQWDIGTNTTIAGSFACGSSQCITLKIPRAPGSTDWQHYRYKVFDSVVPLRNLLWGA